MGVRNKIIKVLQKVFRHHKFPIFKIIVILIILLSLNQHIYQEHKTS